MNDRATTAGTTRYFSRMKPRFPSRTLGKTQFQISPVGFGGYRITDEEPTHHDALRLALTSGCNLMDTSTNYTDGGSERLVGDVLAELIAARRLQRDEVVVVTKVGYVQGPNLERARERKSQGNPIPEMVELTDDCWHCLSPEFIEDQLTRSLERMQLTHVDVLLLHNPEYFLKSEDNHREYYARIRRAMEYLETEVARGRIQFYGISSNTFPSPREAKQYTSLEAIWDMAQELGPENHFAVIQFPMNLYEPGAALEDNNSGKTVLQFAREHQLGTLINRPLNAFHDNKLVRLTDFPSHDNRNVAEELKMAWKQAMELESAYLKIVTPPPVEQRLLAWGHLIRHNFESLSDIDNWKNFLRLQVQPSLEEALGQLIAHGNYAEWVPEYRLVSARLFDSFTAYLENQASFQSDQIAAKIEHIALPLGTSPTLSQKAIRLYLSLPGVDCVLVGMREAPYVRDALNWEPPVQEAEALRALQILNT